MQSLANMLGLQPGAKQHQYLLLMEERATIARELHDSLAQTLSCAFSLRCSGAPPIRRRQRAIIDDFDRTLAVPIAN